MADYNEPLLTPNPITPNQAITFNEELCNGCNKCIDFCRTDVLHPNPVPGKPPIVLYPDECWFAGCCVGACPIPGACQLNPPLQQRVAWKRKDTGEFYRVGMKNPPPPNPKPPVVD